MSSLEHTPCPGSRCGSYDLVREIGTGGMGVVYEAVQTSLKRRVAVKLLADWALSNPQHRERFVQEAEIAARMRHANIVEVHDVGMWGDRPYFVMELLEGRSLADELDVAGAMTPPEIAAFMLPVMSAVAAAHDRGVVHRDLKPENIFIAELDSGIVPKVLDFGISHIVTRPGSVESYVYGTPQYMAPELISGVGCDERSDQYSLGVILHELIKGRLPGSEMDVGEILRRTREEPYPIADLEGVPGAFRDVILRATRRDPADRFEDVRDMSLALRQVSSKTPSISLVARAGDTASRASRMPTQPLRKAPRTLAGLLMGAFLLVAAGAGIVLATGSPDAASGHSQAQASIAVPSALEAQPPVSTREPEADVVSAVEGSNVAPVERVTEPVRTARPPTAAMRRRRGTPMRGAAAEMEESADPWGERALPPEPIGSRMTKLDPWAQ